MNSRSVYLVVVALVVWGTIGVLGSAPISKIGAIVALVALGFQAAAATYWSFRWQDVAIKWREAADQTFAVLKQHDAEAKEIIDHLHEPWRN